MFLSRHYKFIILTAVMSHLIAAKGMAQEHQESSTMTKTSCATYRSSCTTSTESTLSSSSQSDDDDDDDDDDSSTTKSTSEVNKAATTTESAKTKIKSTTYHLVTKTMVSKSSYQTPPMSSTASREKTDHRTIKEKTHSSTVSVTIATPSVSLGNQGDTKEDFVLKMDKEFTPDLKNKTSQAFKDLAKEVERELTKVCKDMSGFRRVEVNSFENGSIMASSSAYFSSGSSSKRSIRSTLDEAYQSGALSSLKVSNIEYQEENSGGGEGGTSTFTYVLIAVGVVAGIALCVFIVSKVRTKAQESSKTAKKNLSEPEEMKPAEDTRTTKQV